MNRETEETEKLLNFITHTAAQIEATMRTDLDTALAGNDPLLREVLLYGLLGGGKRLRPVLAIISARLCGREEDEQLLLLAAAFEYLHVATLIHDDVIDHADNRRGKESVVKKFSLDAAILAGDWLHARSMHLIGQLTGQAGLEIFCAATTAMVDGEFLQLRYLANPAVSEEQYFSVIQRKTAGLISSTCRIGALYAKGSKEQISALATYGEKIGIGFQIIDDLLDYLGNEEATGKKVGNDFVEGKLTLPLIHALAHTDEPNRERMVLHIQGDRTETETYNTCKQIMLQEKSFDYSRQRAEEEISQGIAALSCFDEQAESSREYVTILKGLGKYILSRDH